MRCAGLGLPSQTDYVDDGQQGGRVDDDDGITVFAWSRATASRLSDESSRFPGRRRTLTGAISASHLARFPIRPQSPPSLATTNADTPATPIT